MSELYSLIAFAHNLRSSISVDCNVRREAKLLMSLSCSPPVPIDEGSNSSINDNNNSNSEVASITSLTGRITPTHSVTSTSSGTNVSSSRRNTFCFTCPSLSLSLEGNNSGNSISTPGTILSRTLKLDDKDALRLSSEAMGRNIIESFQKAMEWRIQSWVDSLSTVLVIKERELENEATDDAQQLLYYSNEALLVTALRESGGKVQVREATTSFKVTNKVSSVDERGAPLKKQRTGAENEERKLEEGEYVYNVIHFLEMQCSLKTAGNVQIELNVPGKIKGTFVSSEDYDSVDKLTDVIIDLNTFMLATMIEKSSRIVVRASVETLLKGEHIVVTNAADDSGCGVQVAKKFATIDHSVKHPTAYQTRTPKQIMTKMDESGLVVVTPASSSLASPFYGNSDIDADNFRPQPCQLKLQIPDMIESKKNKQTHGEFLAARLPSKKFLPKKRAFITPHKKESPMFVRRKKGPTLPILVEVACAFENGGKK